MENRGITRTHAVPVGRHSFVLAADGYSAKEVVLDITRDTEIEEKLERLSSGLRKLGEIGTGRGPKSVMFTSDVHTGKVRGMIPVVGIPRGLAASPNGEFLFVANFSDGGIEIVNAEKWQITGGIEGGTGAMRHVVLDAAG